MTERDASLGDSCIARLARGLIAVGGAATVPGHGVLWLAARITLDLTGALFGLYLLTVIVLLLWGWAMSFRRGAASSRRDG